MEAESKTVKKIRMEDGGSVNGGKMKKCSDKKEFFINLFQSKDFPPIK